MHAVLVSMQKTFELVLKILTLSQVCGVGDEKQSD